MRSVGRGVLDADIGMLPSLEVFLDIIGSTHWIKRLVAERQLDW